jgi:signal transduction histidine kinase
MPDLDRVSFDVGPFVATVVTEMESSHPGTVITMDIPAALYAVADRDRLHQVLANLLDNAARHSPAGGRVTVTARPGADIGGLVLEVADEGPGIHPAERTPVFERFSRGSVAVMLPRRPHVGGETTTREAGTGLALAIARWAVDLHDGEIGVVDSARGCRIRVVIPGGRP